jgi:hypothetical protein
MAVRGLMVLYGVSQVVVVEEEEGEGNLEDILLRGAYTRSRRTGGRIVTSFLCLFLRGLDFGIIGSAVS